MLRGLFFLLLLALVTLGAVWIADQPGRVAIAWGVWRIELAPGLVVVALLVFTGLVALLSRLWLVMRRGPGKVRRYLAEDRRRRGYRALTQGMVAVAAGDAREARRQARRADGLLNEPPLTMLLSAQAAQLEGDEDAAAKYFTAMLDRDETRFLGLKGLLNQARRRGDRAAALTQARRAQAMRPNTPWLLEALFGLQAEAGQWRAAAATLKSLRRHGSLSTGEARSRQAALFTAEAAVFARRAAGRNEALRLARRAHRADEDFLPATLLLADLLAEAGRLWRAARYLEGAWARAPHPAILAAYASLRPDEDALARLRRFERLARGRPDHWQTHVMMGTAHWQAALWGEARRRFNAALARLAADGADPDRALCCLLADFETAALAAGDPGAAEAAARHWLARAATAPEAAHWRCGACGYVHDMWEALCRRCGAFATVRWIASAPFAPPGSPEILAAYGGALTVPGAPPPALAGEGLDGER